MYSLLAFTPRSLAWPVAFMGLRPFAPCRLLGGFGSTDLGALNAPQWLVVHTGNLPRLIRAAERARMWNELTFTYVHYDEFDNAAHVMIDHSADAWCGVFESHAHHACVPGGTHRGTALCGLCKSHCGHTTPVVGRAAPAILRPTLLSCQGPH